MANETDIDRCVIGATIDVDIAVRVMKKYQREGESKSVAYARAIEDAVRDVALTAEDYQQIADIVKANAAAREFKRKKRKGIL
jgi:hypothetical protein